MSAVLALSPDKMDAVVVRIGEKKLLRLALAHTQERLIALQSKASEASPQQNHRSGSNEKRKGWQSEDGGPVIGQKKARR